MTRRLRDVFHRLRDFDRGLVAAVGLLCLIGVVMVYDAGSFRAEARTSTTYLMKHLVRLALGLGALLAMARFDYHRLRNALVRWPLVIAGVGLVVATVVFAASGLAGSREQATRWFLFLQPVEIAKLALIVHLAHGLTGGWERISRDRGRTLRLLAVPVVTVVALVLQPNYGNVIVFSIVTVSLLALSGIPASWLARIGIVGAALAAVGVVFVDRIAYRVSIWWDALRGEGLPYQVEQAFIGMGAGGVLGQGFGHSRQRLAFLPDAHTDFIFAVLGEEAGLLGGLVLLFLFVLVAHRGYKIAREAGDGFGNLLAAGLTTMIVVYAVINLGMVTGLLPVMGLPLPFISYGGSALITNLAAVGILLNIDMQHREIRSRLQRMRRA